MPSHKIDIYYALPVGRPNLALSFVRRERATIGRERVKRSIDIVGAALGLLLLLPVLALIALAIVLESPGTPLFLQRRGGLQGASFTIYKFRTMRLADAPANTTPIEFEHGRVTRLGRFLRRTSIDELPQLLNVLRGEMSLVGPRPHALAHDVFYGQRIASYGERYQVRPGLTGLAQTAGLYGPTRDLAAMAARVEMDLEYIREWSLMLDLRILLRTARIFARRPASQ